MNSQTDSILKQSRTVIPRLSAIDAVRGWAILLVMMVHTGSAFLELPYPVKKMTNYGWYGVQLFFIASAFTLLNSWRRQNKPFSDKARSFFLRRFFRIVPMYYLGILIYYFLRPPLQNFSMQQLLPSLTFINAWSPEWLPATEHDWQVMPGGWSISVEFCFYFIFPVLAVLAGNLKRSFIFLMVGIVIMVLCNAWGFSFYGPTYGDQATEIFLFFWLPNQLCIFSLGFIVYFVMLSRHRVIKACRDFLGKQQRIIYLTGFIAIAGMAQGGVFKYFTPQFPWIPTHLLISIIFSILIISLLACQRPLTVVVNSFMERLGEVSFSAYVLHWAVLDHLHQYKDLLGLNTTGWTAIGCFMALFPAVVLLTFLISSVTYRWVERPFIEWGRRLSILGILDHTGVGGEPMPPVS